MRLVQTIVTFALTIPVVGSTVPLFSSTEEDEHHRGALRAPGRHQTRELLRVAKYACDNFLANRTFAPSLRSGIFWYVCSCTWFFGGLSS
jgi:hypothetical protein